MNLNEWEQNYYDLFTSCFENIHKQGNKKAKVEKWQELMVFCKYQAMMAADGKDSEVYLSKLLELEAWLNK